jgi:lysophospholipase L1-like esterase
LAGVVLAVALAAAACTSTPAAPKVPVHPVGPKTAYVAIGASDSLGVGTADPVRQAWPQVFFAAALPAGATFVNLAVAGSTAQMALEQQVPYVASLHPTVVTVLLGVNDLRAGVSAGAFGAQLRSLLGDLRADGDPAVLVANIPPLDHLPAYLACRPNPPADAPPCSIAGTFPPPKRLDAMVAAYNDQIAAVVSGSGAALVDLFADGLAARANGTEASMVSSDGFHPSARGDRLIASAFAAAYRSAK